MASAKCNDILSKVQQAKGAIDTGFEQLGRIKGLVEQATDFTELEELQNRRSENTVLVNRQGGNTLAVLLQEAKNNNCGPEIERRINTELNYAREVARQLNDLGGVIANKQIQIQSSQQAQQKAKEDAAAAQATQKATTTQNNAGTGTPGTAGQGAGASTAPTREGTTSPTPIDTGNNDGLEEIQVTGKKAPPPTPSYQEAPRGADDFGDVAPGLEATAAEEGLEEITVTGTRNTNVGIPPNVKNTQAQATLQDTTNFAQKKDWRFRLSLSPGATYLYKDKNNKLLQPLSDTDGIIFPYTPSVTITYAANYDSLNPTHSNYKIYNYQNSAVDNITITCDFTAQDTYEANYMLAVIHFLRSATKMFYGKDENPKAGTPPPLCYLFGFGQYQFNAHPVLINNFTYTLPTDVDYIRAGAITTSPGQSKANEQPKPASKARGWGELAQEFIQNRLESGIASIGRTIGLSLTPGGGTGGPVFGGDGGFNSQIPPGTEEPTYVPTKINISFSCYPVVSRYDVSNRFSLKDYASGKLLRGTQEKGGGFW